MSRHNPGFEDRVRAFAARLTEYRMSDSTTQDIMATALGISRKTYILMEQGRWLPGQRQVHHMVHTLHRFDPALAVAYAALYDTGVEKWGVAPPAAAASPQAAPRLDPRHARHAYDAAVYAAAEEADVPAKTLRPLVAARSLPMRRCLLCPAVTTGLVLAASAASAATLEVGPGKTYAMPCDAIAAAQAGDTIEVDAAGTYTGNTCAWTTDNLTITGVNGRAKIDLTGVTPAQEKGIFTIGGTASATIANFELSGAAISSADGNNGAGIRHQGLNLTVRNCYIHDNQDGILGAPATANTGTILVENSEFSHNGAGDGFSHNMYIGNFATFTLQFSYSHDGNVGHLVKSRAFTTLVLYNRITDETGGTASYEVDIPNGGTGYVIGNVIEQSPTTQNPTILTFAEEGSPAGYDTHLFVVNNTFVNDLGSGTFVNDATSTPAVLENNIFDKAGTITGQAGATLTTNFDGTKGADPMLTDVASYDVTLLPGSPCIDKGTAPGTNGTQSLAPVFEYVHPLSEVAREVVGSAIDIGAYEYGVSDDAGVIGPDASPPDGGSSSGSASGSGSSSGTGGSGSGGGSSGSSGGVVSSSGGPGDGGSDGESPVKSGGCGCVLASSPTDLALGLCGPGAMLAMLVGRRRSRRK